LRLYNPPQSKIVGDADIKRFIQFLVLFFLLPGFLGIQPASAGQSTEESSQKELVVVHFHTQTELAQLVSQLDVWEVHAPQGTVLAYLSPIEINSLRQAGWQTETFTGLTAAQRLPSMALQLQLTGIPGLPCYRTIQETFTRLQELVSQYPNLAQIIDIGDSWEKVNSAGTGGNDILVLKVTNSLHSGPKPRFFLMAEIHARELTTTETALRFAELLLQGYGSDPDITWLLDYYEVHILPMTNPDGRKQVEENLSSYWRKNTDNHNGCTFWPTYGTDLNRNSSYNWGVTGASSEACADTYMGPEAASEPEVQAVQNYVANLFPGGASPTPDSPAPADFAGLFITLHSYLQLVLWPYGATFLPPPNSTQLQTLGRKLAYFNGYIPEQAINLYPTSGTTDEWAYGTLGVPAFTFEMGTDFYEFCSSFETSTWPTNRDALLYALKAARRPYQNPAGPEIFDVSASQAPIVAGLPLDVTAIADHTRSSTLSGSEPARTIQAARASIDTPSWANSATPIALNAQDGNYDNEVESLSGTIDTHGLAAGKHTLFIEGQDNAGNWGVPTAVFFNITLPNIQMALIAANSRSQALPGKSVLFVLKITNQSNVPDTYDLSITIPDGWDVSLPAASIGPLSPASSALVNLSITIPAAARPGLISLTQFSARSQAKPSVIKRVSLSTEVLWPVFLPAIRQ
jgi:carboxypeptidase T